MKATAVLITKEREYPKEILDALPKFDEVIIETECPSVLRRYELTLKAKNDLIYVQDDDCITDVPELFKHYNGQITNALTQHHANWYTGSGMTLVGWGAFFPKAMVNFDPYIDRFGIDDLLLREADRVFSYLNQPHNSVVMDIINLPTATLGDRMSTNNEHWGSLSKIKERLQQL